MIETNVFNRSKLKPKTTNDTGRDPLRSIASRVKKSEKSRAPVKVTLPAIRNLDSENA